MKTYHAKTGDIPRDWLVVDLEGKPVGRAATQIATMLRGKHKPEFTPSADVGDFIVAVNAEKVTLTGNKREAKRYYRHSGYIGGMHSMSAEEMFERKPEEVIRLAVKGMLPKNTLGRRLLKKLKVYVGAEHPHAAQQPKQVEI
ncbi:MAG: 50S ribosomal protein L13 [Deltaproteobacteria bacterium]|nr:50S ribosomal protein L13 [Deltaproteobacteria bacterium]